MQSIEFQRRCSSRDEDIRWMLQEFIINVIIHRLHIPWVPKRVSFAAATAYAQHDSRSGRTYWTAAAAAAKTAIFCRLWYLLCVVAQMRAQHNKSIVTPAIRPAGSRAMIEEGSMCRDLLFVPSILVVYCMQLVL